MKVECPRCGTPAEEGADCPKCLSRTGITDLLRAAAEPPNGETRELPPEAQVARADAGNHFGRYIRVRLLGRGGMGDVWQAWDTELGRWVALKFPKFEHPDDAERLRREAQAAAKLSHPNVAAVYDCAQAQGRHFLVMQFVDGRTLAEFPRGDRRKLASFVRFAALGVAYAHAHGIVHRDLKPSNVMIESGREQVYVMDFGIAREGPGREGTGLVGTPPYMAPEQIAGATADERTDVYALGATLYELISGAPPFTGDTQAEVLDKIRASEPAPLRGVDADLNTLVLKCLEKDRARRYGSALELAEDLRRWLQGETVVARPPSVLRRLRRALARRRATVWAMAMGLVGVGVAAAFLVPMWERERRERERAELWRHISGKAAEAELYARAGEIEESKRRLRDTLVMCREHLAKDPSATGHYFQGVLLAKLGEREDARRALGRALELDPKLSEARFERGLLLVEEYGSRLELYAQSESAHGRRQEFVGELEAEHSDLVELREQAERDLSVEVGRSAYVREVDAWFGKAELAWLRGDADAARQGLERVLREEPIHAKARVTLARVEWSQGRGEAARGQVSRAIESHRGYAPAYLLRASIYLRARPKKEEFLKQSLADAEAALRMGAEEWRVRNHRGLVAFAREDWDRAAEEWGEVVTLRPTAAFCWYNRGTARYRQSRWDEAVADLSKAIELNDRYAEAFRLRAAARIRKGDFDAAIEDCDRAIRLNPRVAEPYVNRGVARSRKNDWEGAIADHTKAIEVNDRFPDAYRNRALAFRRLGRTPEAIADLERALAVAPADWPNRPQVAEELERLRKGFNKNHR